MAIFEFGSICVEDKSFENTETTKWIWKHIRDSLSIWYNLIQEPIFLGNPNPREIESSFIDALETLATQVKAQLKLNFLHIEATINSRQPRILETLNQRRSYCAGTEAEDDNRSTQFLQLQKNHLIDLQEHFQTYCNTLPVSGFNSARYGINFINSYLLPTPVNERDVEQIVIKTANQFLSFNFGNVQIFDISIFLRGATNVDSFLKAYKTSEARRFFSKEWFNHPIKMIDRDLPPCEAFHNTLGNCNPHEKEYLDYGT